MFYWLILTCYCTIIQKPVYKVSHRHGSHAWVYARNQWLLSTNGIILFLHSPQSKLPVSQPWWYSISILNAVQSGRLKSKHSGQARAPTATPNQKNIHPNVSHIYRLWHPRHSASTGLRGDYLFLLIDPSSSRYWNSSLHWKFSQCARCFYSPWTLRTQSRGHVFRLMSSFLSCLQFYRWSFLSVYEWSVSGLQWPFPL